MKSMDQRNCWSYPPPLRTLLYAFQQHHFHPGVCAKWPLRESLEYWSKVNQLDFSECLGKEKLDLQEISSEDFLLNSKDQIISGSFYIPTIVDVNDEMKHQSFRPFQITYQQKLMFSARTHLYFKVKLHDANTTVRRLCYMRNSFLTTLMCTKRMLFNLFVYLTCVINRFFCSIILRHSSYICHSNINKHSNQIEYKFITSTRNDLNLNIFYSLYILCSEYTFSESERLEFFDLLNANNEHWSFQLIFKFYSTTHNLLLYN